MGLSAPKRRNRISADPNNTAWSRSTTRYGYRILQSQGWKPGDYLGGHDAPHSSHYSAASAGHIRVVLKDGNAGLGAGIGKDKVDTYGLSGFQGILGRLNWKTELKVKEEEDTQRDVLLKLYTGQRYGYPNFVSGGFLVGDTIKHEVDQSGESGSTSTRLDSIQKPSKLIAKSKKRKREPEERTNATSAEKRPKTSILRKDRVAVKEEDDSFKTSDKKGVSFQEIEAQPDEAKVKAEKRAMKEARRAMKQERRQRKIEKEVRREERRQRKLKKQAQKRNGSALKEENIESGATSSAASAAQTAQTATATTSPRGRQHVRHRYIQQKKMASLDPKALKEIFMVKS